MIQQRDPHEVPDFAQSFGQESVFLTGRRITRGMIMATEPGCRIHHDQGLEDFTRMDDRERQTSRPTPD